MRAMSWWCGGLVVLGLALSTRGWGQGQPDPTPDSVPPNVRPDTGTYVVEPGDLGGGSPGLSGPGIPVPEGVPVEEHAAAVALTVLYAVVPDEPLSMEDHPEALWERLEALQNAGKLSDFARWQFTTLAGQEFMSMIGNTRPLIQGYQSSPGGRPFGGPTGGEDATSRRPIYTNKEFGTRLAGEVSVDGELIKVKLEFDQTSLPPQAPETPEALPVIDVTTMRSGVGFPDGNVAIVGSLQARKHERSETAILLVRGRILSRREPARLGQRTLHVIPLRFAQADAVVEIIRSSLEGTEFADAIVRGDARSNQIVLAAAVDHIESLKLLIRLLDESGQPGRPQPATESR
jgi:hypothetical protein